MPKITLANYRPYRPIPPVESVKPFITISREFGCPGYSLGQRLIEKLGVGESGVPWKLYSREIFEKLAEETRSGVGNIHEKRLEADNAFLQILRGVSGQPVASGSEIRARITLMVRNLAREGRVVIVGQGSAACTPDLPNHLSLRFVAPQEWRKKQVCQMMGLDETAALDKMEAVEKERAALREVYGKLAPKSNPFNLTFDCSVFGIEEITDIVYTALRLRGWV